ncbi:hypothetical protein DERF_013061 [Dermatophagoides farinae]|uniref:Uncharacterized protein n=1 Tax=Dermatophagoides farinae TaxID=6954 RepID=A0A922HQR0_DERFA|nr:hypothetical protein DERF_013061 [Dermatophagoides farinae]
MKFHKRFRHQSTENTQKTPSESTIVISFVNNLYQSSFISIKNILLSFHSFIIVKSIININLIVGCHYNVDDDNHHQHYNGNQQ